MLILLLPLAIGVWTWAFAREGAWREAFLKALVLFGVACTLIAEVVSLFHALDRSVAAACWLGVSLAAPALFRKRLPPIRVSLVDGIYLAAIAAILCIAGFTAILSAPNSADAMAYHLPRVIYWVQAHSVAFFPTPYLNQIMLQPFAEYIMLHTYLLSGGDRFVNLVQFTGLVGSIVGVSLIAEKLGLSIRGQIVAALVCATLPNGILQASGAKNDFLLALWLVAAAYFAATRQTIFLGLAVGLALGTKATAYLFVPPLVAAWFAHPLPYGRGSVTEPRAVASGLLQTTTALCLILALNAPQYIRNYQLSGSVLGFDSAQADGLFRWRNDSFGWRQTVSNVLRNISDQLGARSDAWNSSVYETVTGAHRLLGIDPQDPATTWRWSRYGPPRNSNHEADANNRWHLLLLAAAVVWAALARNRRLLLFSAGPAVGFLAFCAYLKWQPFLARLELPLFVIATPLIAALLIRIPWVEILVCLFLASGARLPLLENWTRPLRGDHSLLRNRGIFNTSTI